MLVLTTANTKLIKTAGAKLVTSIKTGSTLEMSLNKSLMGTTINILKETILKKQEIL